MEWRQGQARVDIAGRGGLVAARERLWSRWPIRASFETRAGVSRLAARRTSEERKPDAGVRAKSDRGARAGQRPALAYLDFRFETRHRAELAPRTSWHRTRAFAC